jgi:hypothetical protein
LPRTSSPSFFEHLRAFGYSKRVDVFMFTSGGDTLAAFGLSRLVRTFTGSDGRFSVLVPEKCHSAPTRRSLQVLCNQRHQEYFHMQHDDAFSFHSLQTLPRLARTLDAESYSTARDPHTAGGSQKQTGPNDSRAGLMVHPGDHLDRILSSFPRVTVGMLKYPSCDSRTSAASSDTSNASLTRWITSAACTDSDAARPFPQHASTTSRRRLSGISKAAAP